MPLYRKPIETPETKELPTAVLPVNVISEEKRLALLQLQARIIDALSRAVESEHYAVAIYSLNGVNINLHLTLNNFLLADHGDAVELLERQLQAERKRVRGSGELLREEVPPDATDIDTETFVEIGE